MVMLPAAVSESYISPLVSIQLLSRHQCNDDDGGGDAGGGDGYGDGDSKFVFVFD